MKIRIRFSKTGKMKFIGHLDVMRYFQKAIKRAGIDIAYSQGFSPHPIMSFALPLGVGVTSDGEYVDIQVNSTKSTAESIEALNNVMVEGFKVTDYRLLAEGSKKGMTLVGSSDYIISIKEDQSFIPDKDMWEGIESKFYKASEKIETYKKGKHGETFMDIKPIILDLKAEFNNDDPKKSTLSLRLGAGSKNNLKPYQVVEEAFKFFNVEYNKDYFQVHRIDLMNDEFVSLAELGDKIE